MYNLKRSIPNMFTLGNLLCGFLSIIMIINQDQYNIIKVVPMLIILAMICDFLDGTAARLLKVHNEIGKQLDSLADVVTFGVVPALLLFEIGLSDLGIVGMLVVSLLPVCGATRLARFNIAKDSSHSNSFSGLPITAAGGVIAVLSIYASDMSPIFLVACTLLISFLMVSKVKYPNWKTSGKRMKIATLLLFVVVPLNLMYLMPDKVLHIIFAVLSSYVLYGVIFNFIDEHNPFHKYEEEGDDEEQEQGNHI